MIRAQACAECGAEIVQVDTPGRDRIYCDARCRCRAHRRRRAEIIAAARAAGLA